MKLSAILRIIIVISIILPSTIWCQYKNEVTTPNNYIEQVEIIERGEAIIWFLGHCGFAVKTKDYFLIFDYVENFLRNSYQQPDNPALSTGYINPEEIHNSKVFVFTTHEHGDHYDPIIFEWENHIPDIEYFFGWQASSSTQHNYLIGPRAVWKNGDIEIYTINSNHSGIPEVAYLVKVDSLVIYHNTTIKETIKMICHI